MATINELVVELKANTRDFKVGFGTITTVVSKVSKNVLKEIDLMSSEGISLMRELEKEARAVQKNISSSIANMPKRSLVNDDGEFDSASIETIKSKTRAIKELASANTTLQKENKAADVAEAKRQKEALAREKEIAKASKAADVVEAKRQKETLAREKEIAKALAQTQKNLKKFAKASKEALQGVSTTLRAIGTTVQSTGRTISQIGTQLTQTAFAVGAMVTASSLSIGTSFEENMNRVKAITGTVGAEFLALEEEAKRLGVTTPKTARDIAEGMSVLALSGMTAQEVLANINGVVNLSIITMDDMAVSAQNAADILAQFGRQGLNLNQIMDILSKTATTSNQSVQQLIDAMKFAGPVASDLGVSVEETAAMLGTLANAGVRAGIAGRATRMIFLSLSAPSTGAQKAIEELGLSTYDAEGNFKSMSMILEEMSGLMGDYSKEQRQATLRTIFGTRALGPLSILLNSVSQETDDATESFTAYAQMLKDVNDVSKQTGSVTEELVKDINSGFVQAKNELKSALEGMLIELQQLITVGLEPAVETLTEFIRMFANLEQGSSKILDFFFNLKTTLKENSKQLKELTVEFLGFEIEVGRIVIGLAERITALVNAWGELLGVGPILQLDDNMTQGKIIDKIIAVALMAPAIMVLGKAVSFLGGGIALLGGAFGLLANAIGPIMGIVSSVVGSFGEGGLLAGIFGTGGGVTLATLGPIIGVLILIIGLVKGLIEHFSTFSSRLGSAFSGLMVALKPVVDIFMVLIDIIGDVLAPLFYSLLIPIIRLMTLSLQTLKPQLDGLLLTLRLLGVVLKAVSSVFVALFDIIDAGFKKIEDNKFLSGALKVFAAVLNPIGALTGAVFGDGSNISSDAGLFGSSGGDDWTNTENDKESILDLSSLLNFANTETTSQPTTQPTNNAPVTYNWNVETSGMTPEQLEQFAIDMQTRTNVETTYGGGE